MRYSKALVAILNASTDLQTLLPVSDTAADGLKIYPITIPQEIKAPNLAFTMISSEPLYCQTGLLAPNPVFKVEHETSIIQIDIFALSVSNLYEIAAATRNALEFFTGTSADRIIRSIEVLREQETYEHEINEFRYTIDFEIIHSLNE